MKSDIDDVALQGIEFWSNVSDEEVDLAIEGSEAAELGEPPQRTSRFYAKGALQYLVPILMQKLTQQVRADWLYEVLKIFQHLWTKIYKLISIRRLGCFGVDRIRVTGILVESGTLTVVQIDSHP